MTVAIQSYIRRNMCLYDFFMSVIKEICDCTNFNARAPFSLPVEFPMSDNSSFILFSCPIVSLRLYNWANLCPAKVQVRFETMRHLAATEAERTRALFPMVQGLLLLMKNGTKLCFLWSLFVTFTAWEFNQKFNPVCPAIWQDKRESKCYFSSLSSVFCLCSLLLRAP